MQNLLINFITRWFWSVFFSIFCYMQTCMSELKRSTYIVICKITPLIIINLIILGDCRDKNTTFLKTTPLNTRLGALGGVYAWYHVVFYMCNVEYYSRSMGSDQIWRSDLIWSIQIIRSEGLELQISQIWWSGGKILNF